MPIQKVTKETVDAIIESMPDADRTITIDKVDGTEDVTLDMSKFLLSFANALYKHLEVDEKNNRIKLLTEEVAWAENGYRTK